MERPGEWSYSQFWSANNCPSFTANNETPLCAECGRPHSEDIVDAWGIYFDSLEAPGKFLLRHFRFEAKGLRHFTKPDFAETIEEAREMLPPNSAKLDKTPYRLNVVEVWA